MNIHCGQTIQGYYNSALSPSTQTSSTQRTHPSASTTTTLTTTTTTTAAYTLRKTSELNLKGKFWDKSRIKNEASAIVAGHCYHNNHRAKSLIDSDEAIQFFQLLQDANKVTVSTNPYKYSCSNMVSDQPKKGILKRLASRTAMQFHKRKPKSPNSSSSNNGDSSSKLFLSHNNHCGNDEDLQRSKQKVRFSLTQSKSSIASSGINPNVDSGNITKISPDISVHVSDASSESSGTKKGCIANSDAHTSPKVLTQTKHIAQPLPDISTTVLGKKAQDLRSNSEVISPSESNSTRNESANVLSTSNASIVSDVNTISVTGTNQQTSHNLYSETNLPKNAVSSTSPEGKNTTDHASTEQSGGIEKLVASLVDDDDDDDDDDNDADNQTNTANDACKTSDDSATTSIQTTQKVASPMASNGNGTLVTTTQHIVQPSDPSAMQVGVCAPKTIVKDIQATIDFMFDRVHNSFQFCLGPDNTVTTTTGQLGSIGNKTSGVHVVSMHEDQPNISRNQSCFAIETIQHLEPAKKLSCIFDTILLDEKKDMHAVVEQVKYAIIEDSKAQPETSSPKVSVSDQVGNPTSVLSDSQLSVSDMQPSSVLSLLFGTLSSDKDSNVKMIIPRVQALLDEVRGQEETNNKATAIAYLLELLILESEGGLNDSDTQGSATISTLTASHIGAQATATEPTNKQKKTLKQVLQRSMTSDSEKSKPQLQRNASAGSNFSRQECLSWGSDPELVQKAVNTTTDIVATDDPTSPTNLADKAAIEQKGLNQDGNARVGNYQLGHNGSESMSSLTDDIFESVEMRNKTPVTPCYPVKRSKDALLCNHKTNGRHLRVDDILDQSQTAEVENSTHATKKNDVVKRNPSKKQHVRAACDTNIVTNYVKAGQAKSSGPQVARDVEGVIIEGTSSSRTSDIHTSDTADAYAYRTKTISNSIIPDTNLKRMPARGRQLRSKVSDTARPDDYRTWSHTNQRDTNRSNHEMSSSQMPQRHGYQTISRQPDKSTRDIDSNTISGSRASVKHQANVGSAVAVAHDVYTSNEPRHSVVATGNGHDKRTDTRSRLKLNNSMCANEADLGMVVVAKDVRHEQKCRKNSSHSSHKSHGKDVEVEHRLMSHSYEVACPASIGEDCNTTTSRLSWNKESRSLDVVQPCKFKVKSHSVLSEAERDATSRHHSRPINLANVVTKSEPRKGSEDEESMKTPTVKKLVPKKKKMSAARLFSMSPRNRHASNKQTLLHNKEKDKKSEIPSTPSMVVQRFANRICSPSPAKQNPRIVFTKRVAKAKVQDETSDLELGNNAKPIREDTIDALETDTNAKDTAAVEYKGRPNDQALLDDSQQRDYEDMAENMSHQQRMKLNQSSSQEKSSINRKRRSTIESYCQASSAAKPTDCESKQQHQKLQHQKQQQREKLQKQHEQQHQQHNRQHQQQKQQSISQYNISRGRSPPALTKPSIKSSQGATDSRRELAIATSSFGLVYENTIPSCASPEFEENMAAIKQSLSTCLSEILTGAGVEMLEAGGTQEELEVLMDGDKLTVLEYYMKPHDVAPCQSDLVLRDEADENDVALQRSWSW